MDQIDQKNVALAIPDLALTAYLDSLLKQVDEARNVKEVCFPAEPAIQSWLDDENSTDVNSDREIALESLPQKIPETLSEPASEPASELNPELHAELNSQSKPDIEVSQDEPFQALVFMVDDVRFAVRLNELKRIICCEEAMTQLPGQSSHVVGTLQDGEHNICVIDTQKLLMPERVRTIEQSAINSGYQRVLMFGNGDNALACDEIGSVIKLEPEDVHWQSSRGSRRWLAGTVVESMCALLELNELERII